MSVGHSPFVFYYYSPSLPAAAIFTVLFGLSTLLHTFQLIRSRAWFMIPFAIGGIFEIVGYIGRILSAMEAPGPYDKIPYIIQSLLLLLGPLLFAASVYMELGRIVVMVEGESKLFIRRTWLTKLFVFGDFACFVIQAYGSSMMASKDPSKVETSNYVVIAGLFLQVAFFGLFVVAATIFHFRLAQSPTTLARKQPWLKHMTALYVVSALILARSIFRGVEYVQGHDGYIMRHEAFLYALDAAPMIVAAVTMNVIHPGELGQRERHLKNENEMGDYRKVESDNESA